MAGGWGEVHAAYRLGFAQRQAGLTPGQEERRRYLVKEVSRLEGERKRLNIELAKGRSQVFGHLVNAQARVAEAAASFDQASAKTVTAYAQALQAYNDDYLRIHEPALLGKPTEGFSKVTTPQVEKLGQALGARSNEETVQTAMNTVMTTDLQERIAEGDPAAIRTAATAISQNMVTQTDSFKDFGEQYERHTRSEGSHPGSTSESATNANKFRAADTLYKQLEAVITDGLKASEQEYGYKEGTLSRPEVVQSVVNQNMPDNMLTALRSDSPERAAAAVEREESQGALQKIEESHKTILRDYGASSPALRNAIQLYEKLEQGDGQWLDDLGFARLDPSDERSEIEEMMMTELRELNELAKRPDPLDAAVYAMTQRPGFETYKKTYGFENDLDAVLWAARDNRGLRALTYIGARSASDQPPTDAQLRQELRQAGHPTRPDEVGSAWRQERREGQYDRGVAREGRGVARDARRAERFGQTAGQFEAEVPTLEDDGLGSLDTPTFKEKRMARREARQAQAQQDEGRAAGVGERVETDPTKMEGIGSRLSQRIQKLLSNIQESPGRGPFGRGGSTGDTSTPGGEPLSGGEKKAEDDAAEPGSGPFSRRRR